MPDSSHSEFSQKIRPFENRAIIGIVFLYQVAALICFAILPFWALEWSRAPFIGAFVENTMVLNKVEPTRPGSWELRRLDLPYGYRILAVDDHNVETNTQLNQVLSKYTFGETVALSLQSPAGAIEKMSMRLEQFSPADAIGYFLVPYLIGLIYLASSLYVFFIRRGTPAGRAFSLFATSVAITTAGLFDLYTTNRLVFLWTLSLALAGGALFNLASLFPEELPWVSRYPSLRWLGYIPALLLAVYAFPKLYGYANPTAYAGAWRLEYLFATFACLFFFSSTLILRRSSSSPIVREQTRLILLGFLVSFGPMAIWFILTLLQPAVSFSPYLLIPLAIFPIATSYAIIRYRLLNADYLISQASLYAILTILAATGYGLLVSGFSLIFGSAISPTNPVLIGLLVFILAVFLSPIRSRLQRLIDSAFFRGQAVYRIRLQEFSRELTSLMELSAIIKLLRRYAQQALLPSQLHIFIHNPLSDQYIASPDENGRPTTDIRFSSASVLVQMLSGVREAMFLGDLASLPKLLEPESARLAILGCQVFMPLPGRQGLTGWLALSQRLSGEPYSGAALDFLASLSDQAVLAIERAQVVDDLERRVREMNVLTRVAQGTNFTVNFDDILELIYAQTNQVISTRDFFVAIYDTRKDTLVHVFDLENDERILERENKPLHEGMGLEWEVVHSQRPLICSEYDQECHSRGVSPILQNVYAWMGVPLNAGAETVGVISIANRDAALAYTEEQRNLLQAIADQSAGAVVKARLLLESEGRARQLATLNEIGRSLTSTLELNPLLNQILESATQILNCEAGSLFLVDNQTGELVFEVVNGPVASDLVGKRIPPGKGLVGEAVETHKAIIANDARRRKRWFEVTDLQTGFTTQDLLVVPMAVKDDVIGVIEVINKGDGSPFNQDDQELLTTFASQATIAIENARLYTMTDQALAARVEELSVMQRIDRELNASLDVDRALQITLDWAMSQSGADAGFVGMVTNEGVQLMASKGYGSALEAYQDRNEDNSDFSRDFVALKRVIQSGQPEQAALGSSNSSNGRGEPEEFSLLVGARSQIAVPIQRDVDVIGVLLLECKAGDGYSEEVTSFLTRLSDHAAIAIANAQLYKEVQEANLAKSKFVSFVAHELKNPMASIKGYTELVAGGMAGAVNEMQSSFLSTVRTNVDRMNTIVSDLNDLTKIQVGSLRLDFKAVQSIEVVEEVIRTMRREVEEKEQQLKCELPEDLPLVWADQFRLGQILTNLISNANKYTPKGGKILISAERSPENERPPGGLEVVHMWVQDSGIGIDLTDQENIFQQYFRTEASREIAAGTGLGLNITKSLVEMQGGRIWFESVPGQGTTFHFTIPIAETT